MLLIPMVRRLIIKTADTTIWQIWLLLERNGTHTMSVGSAEEADAFAAENGLTIVKRWIEGDSIFLDIATTPSLAEFYTWSEIAPGQQPMREVWRPFVWSAPDMGSNEALDALDLGPKTAGFILRLGMGQV